MMDDIKTPLLSWIPPFDLARDIELNQLRGVPTGQYEPRHMQECGHACCSQTLVVSAYRL